MEQATNPCGFETSRRDSPQERRTWSGSPPPVVIAPIRPVVAAREITGVVRTRPTAVDLRAPSVKKMTSDVKTAPLTLADARCGKGTDGQTHQHTEPREVQRSWKSGRANARCFYQCESS
jgi:hypothetical protein